MSNMTIHQGYHGRYFEDFVVDDVYEHPLGRTITETDNTWFTLLTQNTAPIHFDHEYAKNTDFGQPLVVATFTLALVAGQSVIDVSQNVYANVGWNDIKLPNPVFAGDTIRSRSTVLSARESKSRPYLGLVTVLTEGYNQRNETVISYERSVLVYKRGFGPRHAAQEGTSPA
ncbi:MaoC family dehydratase [Rhodococcus rhodochrous]|nr:MaoC family dehydratase [Rhodococcus rhodochrous]